MITSVIQLTVDYFLIIILIHCNLVTLYGMGKDVALLTPAVLSTVVLCKPGIGTTPLEIIELCVQSLELQITIAFLL